MLDLAQRRERRRGPQPRYKLVQLRLLRLLQPATD
jgi:hypothetical protein